MAPIISVENLSKKYVLGHQKQQGSYTNMRDAITDGLRGLGRALATPFSSRNSAGAVSSEEEFWALNDVSFSIEQGERVGIIGRNGAGKSTLLKILSRITEPTSGRIGINGRVASLLEVGTGFHPELSGRENIYLNGAILGMSRVEIQRKFDEIVAFSEVEKFLDTPVKRYSSGMYVRLAFAVAAHLEPEILIVDEVLAVGDAQFQKKCLGKMEQVGEEGRTILFVSHNMAAVNAMCSRGILLEHGIVKNDGPPKVITDCYLNSTEATPVQIRESDKPIHICEWKVIGASEHSDVVFSGEEFSIEVSVQNHDFPVDVSLGIAVADNFGTRAFGALSSNYEEIFKLPVGKKALRFSLNPLPLNEGHFWLSVAIHSHPSGLMIDRWDSCLCFEVVDRSGRFVHKNSGLMIVDPTWSSGELR